MASENFVKVDGWDATLEPCPFCGSAAEMWSRESGGVSLKVACCSNSGDDFGGDFGDPGCPMYLPGEDFYKNTKLHAREVWNTRPPND